MHPHVTAGQRGRVIRGAQCYLSHPATKAAAPKSTESHSSPQIPLPRHREAVAAVSPVSRQPAPLRAAAGGVPVLVGLTCRAACAAARPAGREKACAWLRPGLAS